MLLASCQKDENTEPEKIERTVLIYFAAENNLSDFIASDMREIIQGTKELATNNKLILFVDANNKTPFFMKVEKGDTVRLKTMETELKSSDPETLYMAMKYAIDNFPADDYGLVLWGHSDGWIIHSATANARTVAGETPSADSRRAYGVDYGEKRTYMNIPDMAKALERLPKLKFLFADCCCFMCIEDVYELRKCSDYIIGSPAEIPGEGAPYQTVVPTLFSKDSTFYKQIVDRYYEQKSDGYDLPLSVVKTSELDNLAQATATTLQSFAADIEPDTDGCRYPDMNERIFYYNHTQYDMQDFILKYASEEQYTEWKRVFDKAVPVNTYSFVWMANHILYKNRNYTAFAEFSPTEKRMGSLGMFVPQSESNAKAWNPVYLNQLDITMSTFNSQIKSMQWYEAAKLSEMGW